MESIDMAEIILEAYQLVDEIKQSPEVQEYLARKREMEESPEASKLIAEFQRVKELYEETRRFGIFHPDYHQVREKVKTIQKNMLEQKEIQAFKQAETKLDVMLYEISKMIAKAISPSIKVPHNQAPLLLKKSLTV